MVGQGKGVFFVAASEGREREIQAWGKTKMKREMRVNRQSFIKGRKDIILRNAKEKDREQREIKQEMGGGM